MTQGAGTAQGQPAGWVRGTGNALGLVNINLSSLYGLFVPFGEAVEGEGWSRSRSSGGRRLDGSRPAADGAGERTSRLLRRGLVTSSPRRLILF